MKDTNNRNEKEKIRRRIQTLIRKGYEVGEFDGVEVAVVVFHHYNVSIY